MHELVGGDQARKWHVVGRRCPTLKTLPHSGANFRHGEPAPFIGCALLPLKRIVDRPTRYVNKVHTVLQETTLFSQYARTNEMQAGSKILPNHECGPPLLNAVKDSLLASFPTDNS